MCLGLPHLNHLIVFTWLLLLCLSPLSLEFSAFFLWLESHLLELFLSFPLEEFLVQGKNLVNFLARNAISSYSMLKFSSLAIKLYFPYYFHYLYTLPQNDFFLSFFSYFGRAILVVKKFPTYLVSM